MKLKATKGFCLGAGVDVSIGDVFDANDRDAAIHIQKGRAVKADDREIKAAAKAKAEADAKAKAEADAKAKAEADAKAKAEADAKKQEGGE